MLLSGTLRSSIVRAVHTVTSKPKWAVYQGSSFALLFSCMLMAIPLFFLVLKPIRDREAEAVWYGLIGLPAWVNSTVWSYPLKETSQQDRFDVRLSFKII